MAQSRFGGQVVGVQAPAGGASASGVMMPPTSNGEQPQDMSMVQGMTQPSGQGMLPPPEFMAGGGQVPTQPTPPMAANPTTPSTQRTPTSRFGGTVVNDIRRPAVNPALMAELPESIKPEMASQGGIGRYAGMTARNLAAGAIGLEDFARMGLGAVGRGAIGLTYLSTVPARVLGFNTSKADEFLAEWDAQNTSTYFGSKAEQFKEGVDALTDGAYAPQTEGERIFSTAVEFVGGGLGPTAVLGKAGKAANALEAAGRASEISGVGRAGQFLSYQSLRDVAAAGGAGAAMQGAEEADLGPASAIIAPIVGAVAGYGTAAGVQSAAKTISNPSQLLLKAARITPEKLAKEINADVVSAADATGVRLTPDAATNAAAAKTMMQKLNSMAITQDHFRTMMDEVDGSFLKSYEKQLDSLSTDTFASADEAVQTLKPAIQTAEAAAEARASALYEAADMALPADATHLPTNTIEYLKKSLGKLDESLLPSRDEAAVRNAFAKLAEGVGTSKVTEGIKNAMKELDTSIANASRQLARTQDTGLAEDLERSIRNSQTLKETLTALQPVLNDPQFMKGGIRTLTDENGIPVMQIDPMLARQNAPKVKQLTATIRSLNQTIAWDDEVRGVKQLLEGAKASLKRDLEEYGQTNEAWYSQWREANKVFGTDVGERFRTGVVRSMITGERPTAILKMLNSTSAVKALDTALSETENGKKVASAIKRYKLEEILGKRLQNATTEDVQYGQYAAAMNPAKKEEVALIRALAGEQYTQLENLATVARALAESYARYGNPSRTGNRMMDFLFPQDGWAQAGQALLTYATGGLWGVAGYGVMQATPRMMAKQLTDPKFITLMKNAVGAQVKQDASATTKAMRELTYWYRDTMNDLGEGPIMRFSDDFKQEFMKARGERGRSGNRLYSGIPIQGAVELTEDVVRAGYKALKPSDVMIDDMANTDLGGGFASTIGNALNGLKTRKATGRQWKVELEKAGARPEELEFTHVGPFLEQNADKVMSRATLKQMVEYSKPNVQIVGLAERLQMANPDFLKEKGNILARRKLLDAEFGQEYADTLGIGEQYKAMMEQLGGFEKIRSDWSAGFNRDSDVDALGALLDAATKASGGKQDVKEALYSVARRAMKAEGTIIWDERSALEKVSRDMGISPEGEDAKTMAKKVAALTKKYAEKDMMVSGSATPETTKVKPSGVPIEGRAQYAGFTAQKDQNLFENKFELLVKFPHQADEFSQNIHMDLKQKDFARDMFKKYGEQAGVGDWQYPGQMEKMREFMNSDERMFYDFTVAAGKVREEKSFSYNAPHFNDKGRDLLAHARVNITPDAQGNRMMVIDEVQSDLHNTGRDEGYVPYKNTSASQEEQIGRLTARAEELRDQLVVDNDRLDMAQEALDQANEQMAEWRRQNMFPRLRELGVEVVEGENGFFTTNAPAGVELPDDVLREIDTAHMNARREIVGPADSAHSQIMQEVSSLEEELGQVESRLAGDYDWMMVEADEVAGAPETAPLRNTWSEMLVRRAIKFAVDNGIDKVGITSGREQAARWNLGQWIDDVTVMPDYTEVDGFKHNTDGVLIAVKAKDGTNVDLARIPTSGASTRTLIDGKYYYAVPRDKLANIFGKDRAAKIVETVDNTWSEVVEKYGRPKDHFDMMKKDWRKSVSGEAFFAGGEGRVKAYDEILMRSVNKLLRKYGGGDAAREAMPTQLPESLYSELRNNSELASSSMFTGDRASPQAVKALKELGIDVSLEDLARNRTGEVVKKVGVDPDKTAETWTFRIPEKLKEEYRNSGVPFFAIPAMVGVGAAMGNGEQ